MPPVPRHISLPPAGDFRPFDLGEALDEFDRRLASGELRDQRPIPLGFPELDGCLGGGAQLEDLILLGGPAGVGKTIAGLQAAARVAASGDALAIYLCYEHSCQTLLSRLICCESVSDPDDPQPSGVARDEIAAAIRDYYGEVNAARAGPGLDVQWLLERLPHAERAWHKLRRYLDRLWLVKGDGLYTTDDKLGAYLAMARQLGWERIILFVDYIQRLPVRPDFSTIPLSAGERIDLGMRALKGYALSYHLPIVGVAAADEAGLRRERVHFENLWGGALVQYTPDAAVIINRDSPDAATGARRVRLAIEKNRNGPSEVEFRHALHGQYYCLSTHGTLVPEEESYQRDRGALQRPPPAGRPGLDPSVAMLFTMALNRPDADPCKVWRMFRDAMRAEDGGGSRIEQLAAKLGLEEAVTAGN